MVRVFSLDRVVKSAASFDPAKLVAFQQRYMSALPLEAKVEACWPFVRTVGWDKAVPDGEAREYVRKIIAAAGDRIVMAGDILRYDDFFCPDNQLAYDAATFEKRLVRAHKAPYLLAEFLKWVRSIGDFTAAALQDALQQFVANQGITSGDIIHALRAAVTGKAVGFGLYETMEILGRPRCEARIRRALERLPAPGASHWA
jgi:glutamyl-tRNA synthetase